MTYNFNRRYKNRLGSAQCRYCNDKVLGDGMKRIWHIWKYHYDVFLETFEDGYNKEPTFYKLFATKEEQLDEILKEVKRIDKEEESIR